MPSFRISNAGPSPTPLFFPFPLPHLDLLVLATTSTTITGRSGDSCTWWRWSIYFDVDRALVLFKGPGTDHVQAVAQASQQEPMSRRLDLDFVTLLYVDLTALFGTLSCALIFGFPAADVWTLFKCAILMTQHGNARFSSSRKTYCRCQHM
jgi:hypothetical protein